MEYRTLGRTDLEVSALGIGGATFGREIDGPEAWSLLDRAVRQVRVRYLGLSNAAAWQLCKALGYQD